MPLYLKDDDKNRIKSIFIAPNCYILGDIILESGTSIWFGTNIRSDDDKTIIKKNTAILENCYIEDSIIGENCVISHGAIIHKAKVGNNVFVGLGARILNNSKIGDNCLIGAGTLILPGKSIPPNSVVIGSPSKILRPISTNDLNMIKAAIVNIKKNAMKYAKMFNGE